MKRFLLLAPFLVVLFLAFFAARAGASSRLQANASWLASRVPSSAFVPGQVLAALKPDVSKRMAGPCASCTFRINEFSGLPVQAVRQNRDNGVVLALSVPFGQEKDWVEKLRSTSAVRWAEPNYYVEALAAPNDPLWPDQWWQQTIATLSAWDIAWGAKEVVVAVVDTGVDLNHPDLGPLWFNEDEIPDNRVDDDANGKVDDMVGWHWYFDENGNPREDNDVQIPIEWNPFPNPKGFHGMHVAGIVNATVDNGVGVAGVARGPRLMVLRVLNEYGTGTMLDVASAIHYAVDNGARVINLSLGATENAQVVQDAVAYATERNVMVVAAAGNGGSAVYYPAALPNVLAVGGTTEDDELYERSSRGPEIDLVAPATHILSTWAASVRGGYFEMNGTSMAAPQAAAAAALLFSLRPEATVEQVRDWLQQAALDLGEPGWDALYGWGRLRVDRALALASADFSLSLTTSASQASVGEEIEVRVRIVDESGSLAGSGLPVQVGFVEAPEEAALTLTTRGEARAALVAPFPPNGDGVLTIQALWREQIRSTEIEITPLLHYLPFVGRGDY
ncbi:MAG: S8 family serine peptidase [Chloroflexi bacterium]|nr:S8 family serine peptidase [Chloroflexota bacterium]